MHLPWSFDSQSNEYVVQGLKIIKVSDTNVGQAKVFMLTGYNTKLTNYPESQDRPTEQKTSQKPLLS